MLHLLMGWDRIALSDHLMGHLCASPLDMENSRILIVPEQFSHNAEVQLCRVGGDRISRFAEVLSFSRMADRLSAAYGGAAADCLDRGGKMLAMAAAAEQVSMRIKYFAAVLRKPEFLCDVVALVDEFRSYCLQPSELLEASYMADGQFSQKLLELSYLYEAYLSVCDNGQADPSGKLVRLKKLLAESDWAESRHIFLDGFLDFTGAEIGILEELLQKSPHVWVTLPVGNGTQIASPARNTAQKLQRIAERAKIPFETISIDHGADRSACITFLLQNIFDTTDVKMSAAEQIKLNGFVSAEEECRCAVLDVKTLMASGVRCRDISIACADMGNYEAPLRAALRTSGLPFYFAGREDLLGRPIVYAVLASLSAAVGPMDYEDVALYLKSGLSILSQDRIDRLDLYAYRWNIRGSQWERPWVLHPRGFGELWSDDDRAVLAVLNEEKETAIRPLLDLRSQLSASKNTGEMVVAVYDFLEKIQLRRRLEQKASELGGQAGQELVQLYDILSQSLEQTWLIVGTTVRSAEDFVALYRMVLTQYHVGTIPAGIDQIYVGSLQDLRHKETEHLFILGASDGNFPAYKTGEGLLTELEREQLLSQNLTLSPLRADQMDHELAQIYQALSSAKESICISYSGDQPSWLYRRARDMFPGAISTAKQEIFLDIPSLAALRLRHGDHSMVSVEDLEQWEEHLRALRDYDFNALSRDMVERLYGKQLYLSASRIEKYGACRFAFFMAYGLKAEPRKQAKMDPSAFGTFVHEVLEKTVKRVISEGGFRKISEERLTKIAAEEIDTYAGVHFPQQTQRAAYLFNRSCREIMEIVMDLGEELRHSLFQPVDCELEFSAKGDLSAVEVQGQNILCRISGFVDRVDLYERDGETYVRVVDYKTGHKDFDYTDVLNGTGLQMLIYLFALKQYGAAHYGVERLHPSGVMYVPARTEYTLTPPMPQDVFVEERHREERRRRGLIRGDDILLAAMEEDPRQPCYMPYRVGKNGNEGDLATPHQMELLEHHVKKTLSTMADAIASGNVTPNPIVRGQDSSCRFCDYYSVCHRDLCKLEVRPMAATTAKVFWEKLEEDHNGG